MFLQRPISEKVKKRKEKSLYLIHIVAPTASLSSFSPSVIHLVNYEV